MTGRPGAGQSRTRRRLGTAALVTGVLVLLALPLLVGGRGRSFAGTDGQATAAIERADPGYRRWFLPVFQPASAEVESGLFAIQAALGAGVLGYVLGRLHGRRERGDDEGPADGSGDHAGGQP